MVEKIFRFFMVLMIRSGGWLLIISKLSLSQMGRFVED